MAYAWRRERNCQPTFSQFVDGIPVSETNWHPTAGEELTEKAWVSSICPDHHWDIVETGNDSWRFKGRDDDQTTRARALSATLASSDGANAIAKTRRSRVTLGRRCGVNIARRLTASASKTLRFRSPIARTGAIFAVVFWATPRFQELWRERKRSPLPEGAVHLIGERFGQK